MSGLPIAAGRSAAFRRLLGKDLATLEREGFARRIASGLRWGEGPAYLGDDVWVFSDIPNNRMMRWCERSGFSNGNTRAADGALLTCEHGARRVTRTDSNGVLSVICSSYDGKRLNSPNDLVEAADGAIWFSDPTYGILSDVEGYKAAPEQPANCVYRYDVTTGALEPQVRTLKMPNGLAFAPNGQTLYVADSGADMGPEVEFDEDGPREVHQFAIDAHGRAVEPGRILARVKKGVPDGIRCDEAGFLWVASGYGLECFDPNGNDVGSVATHETLSNLAFGGEGGMSMLLALASSVYILKAT
jgi:gluconolactonase